MKQLQKQSGITIFYSYASADSIWRDQFSVHLSQLKHDGLIKEWYDQQILAGSDRVQEIDQAIRSADIILLLISADFLASDVQYQIEMLQALERHKRGEARVIPIIVRPCDWQSSPFAHLQCLPRNGEPITSWSDRDMAFLTITRELRRIVAQQQFPNPLLSNTQRQHRTRLLKQVRATWIERRLDQSLSGATWIDLHLQEQPDALENPWLSQVQELVQAPRPLPDGTSILQAYEEADGELLILGEGGSGKTTLLLGLARALLDRALTDERLLIPVVFNLSSWAQKQKPLAEWLTEELKTKYRIPHQIVEHWIKMNQVLPLLDGLDEVASEARLACAHAILDYQQNRERNSLVVCCRSTEYQDLALPFPFNRAVSLLPLAEEQIETYLSSIPEQLDGLRQALQDDPEIAREASLPLMLNIFTQAYRGETSKPLVVDAHHKTIRPVVFAHYVQRMLTRRKQLLSWRQEDMCHWLTFIARVLQKRQRDDFEVGDLLRPDWLSASQQRLYRWSIRLFYGLLLGTTFGVSFGVVSGLLTGLIVGLLIGLLNLLQKPYQSNLKPYQSNPEPQTIVRGYLVLGPLVGLFFGCIYGLIVGWSFGLFLALIMGLCCSLMGIVPLFILRFWLWYTNCLPWRLVPFLDEAVARLLLYSYRPWGPHDFRHDQFWFRHQFLLEYFATLDNPASPETVSSEGEA